MVSIDSCFFYNRIMSQVSKYPCYIKNNYVLMSEPFHKVIKVTKVWLCVRGVPIVFEEVWGHMGTRHRR